MAAAMLATMPSRSSADAVEQFESGPGQTLTPAHR